MTSLNNLQNRIDALRQRVETSFPWRRSFRKQPHHLESEIVNQGSAGGSELSTIKYTQLGWAIIILFLVGGITWASVTKLDGAAIAMGTVGVETNRKSIAHLEGGIIRAILVKEGDYVVKGQPIVEMDATRAHASLDLLQGRWDAFIAKKARLDAEEKRLDAVKFPDQLLDRAEQDGVLDLMESEMALFETRSGDRADEDAILVERIAKKRADIRGLSAKIATTRHRLDLLIEERDMMASLVEDGLIARNRLLSIERQVVSANGELKEITAQIASANDQISEYEIERRLIEQRHRTEVANERVKVLEAVSEVEERVRAAKDVLNRATVIAPNSGRVLALRQHTIGGIVQAGEPIVDIIPDQDRIVFDLKIHPNDIDVVYPGQTAQVRLTAFNTRTTPLLDGEVIHVSADQIVDADSGIGYFYGRVVPSIQHGKEMPQLQPGMQAEVYLITAQRTVLDYLVDPFVRATSRAAREL